VSGRARQAGTVYLLHFDQPYKHARHYVGWASNVKRRLAEHQAGHGARLLAVVRAAGIGWQLARMWPGSRARERQIKRQGGHARKCPLCGVRPRHLPRNADGSLSRRRTTDAQKAVAGVMTAAQLAEHTALRRGAITGKPARHAERGPLADDPWAVRDVPGPPGADRVSSLALAGGGP
jgi:predicted GIY-YIG superfamily endonuclease